MKVFISYHRGDTAYKNTLVEYLETEEIPYYVVPEDYSFDGLHHEHIAQIIIDEVKWCSVTICIIGQETYSRPHVDHEIKATIKGGISTRRGLVGLMLDNRGDSKNNINYDIFPNRIQDNYTDEIPYVVLGQWASFKSELKNLLNEAYDNRYENYEVKNNRKLMKLRKGKYYDQ